MGLIIVLIVLVVVAWLYFRNKKQQQALSTSALAQGFGAAPASSPVGKRTLSDAAAEYEQYAALESLEAEEADK